MYCISREDVFWIGDSGSPDRVGEVVYIADLLVLTLVDPPASGEITTWTASSTPTTAAGGRRRLHLNGD